MSTIQGRIFLLCLSMVAAGPLDSVLANTKNTKESRQAQFLFFQNTAKSLDLIDEITGGDIDAARAEANFALEVFTMNKKLHERKVLSDEELKISEAEERVKRSRFAALTAKRDARQAASLFNSMVGDFSLTGTEDITKLEKTLRLQWEAQCLEVREMKSWRLAELELARFIHEHNEILFGRRIIAREELLKTQAQFIATQARYEAMMRIDTDCMAMMPTLPRD